MSVTWRQFLFQFLSFMLGVVVRLWILQLFCLPQTSSTTLQRGNCAAPCIVPRATMRNNNLIGGFAPERLHAKSLYGHLSTRFVASTLVRLPLAATTLRYMPLYVKMKRYTGGSVESPRALAHSLDLCTNKHATRTQREQPSRSVDPPSPFRLRAVVVAVVVVSALPCVRV